MKKEYLCFLFFLTLPYLGIAQENWELRKNENGIEVYARKLNNEAYKEVRVRCEVNASPDKLIALLKDVKHHKDWVYNTKSSYIVSQTNPDTVVYYSEVNVPWPASNRDFIVQLSFNLDRANKFLKIKAAGMPKVLPEKSGLVRVPYSLGIWTVKLVSDHKMEIEYTLKVNPGGSLPAWLVNLTATTGPYNSFRSMKQLLEQQAK